MAEPRESYLPLRKRDLVDLCAEALPAPDHAPFRELCRILASVFHFEFHARLEQLKDCHAPFDVDADTVSLTRPTAAELPQLKAGLVAGLEELLQAANYERIPQSTLQASLLGESLFKVRLAVNFDDFEEMLLFRRGQSQREATLRIWGGLRRKTIKFLNFSRVVMLVRFREADHFDERRRRDLPFEPGTTVIKMFRNVPQADLEMLFPNTAVRMKTIDKLLIGVPAAVGGILVLTTKLLGTLLLIGALFAFWFGMREEPVQLDQAALLTLAIGLGTLGVFVWKQFNRFKTRKIRFLKALTENLYFKNLDNNAGVFHRLIDEAEEEECKEAIAAYWYLIRTGGSIPAEAIDRGIEAWLRQHTERQVDFEIGDAMQKLERLGLVLQTSGGLQAVPLKQAKAKLDEAWDGYFDYELASP